MLAESDLCSSPRPSGLHNHCASVRRKATRLISQLTLAATCPLKHRTEIMNYLPYCCHGNNCPPGPFANSFPKRRGELERVVSTILKHKQTKNEGNSS